MLLRRLVVLALATGTSFAQQLDSRAPSEDLGATGEGEAGSGSWSVRLGYYDRADDGSAGNPFLDESLTVIEPIVLFDTQVTEDFGYWAQLSYDNVSSASIERLNKFPDQSGATGEFYAGVDFGVRLRLDPDRLFTSHFGVSTEYDYTSFNLGAGLLLEAPDRNSSWRYSLDAFHDSIDIIRFDGTEEGSDERISVAGNVAWYQVLSPLWHGEFGLTLARQSGFLETAYNAVVIEDDALPPNTNLDNLARGTEITEELPDERLRVSVYGRARRLMGEGRALELGGRVYQDDWGITAFHLEPRWIMDLSEAWMMELRYRYYDQSAADAWSKSFTTETEERTQDSDLGPFDSHLLGGRFYWFTGVTRWDFGLDYLMRSDDLDHVFASLGWTWSF